MSGLDNLKKRLSYYGGNRQDDRMIEDKLRSLKKALLYSYQSAIAVVYNTGEPREFRCLINPNKINMELDDKMLSIPFKDIRLNKEKPEDETTSEGIEDIGVKVGDVITWKGKTEEDNTHWLIYSRYLQERAYFRGLMRQCDTEIKLDNGSKYWVYLKGPDEKSIDWLKTKHFIFNDLNYTLEMYISNNQETKQFFHRFKKVKVKGKNWEVQAIDDITNEGILAVYLKEDYTNEYAPTQVEDFPSIPEDPETSLAAHIDGPDKVHPYDIVSYSISNTTDGQWLLSNKRAIITKQDSSIVEIEITTGRSGDISLIYRVAGQDDIVKNISILSL